MSLKAKIEAVIYAAEEPVTLAQLAGLFGQEAQRALEDEDARLAARQPELPIEAPDADAGAEEPPAGEAVPETGAESAAEHAGEDADKAQAAERRKAREADRRVRDYLRTIVDELMRDLSTGDRGIEVREIAGGYRMATKPEYHDAVRGFVRSLKPALRLSLQALETLAVVAYKQPVTAPEVSEIRGVDSGGVLGSLMARKLVATAGRKQVIGRPILYRTTKDFLVRFGLKDVAELPSIEEFERMAGELAEQEEMDMPETSRSTEQEHRLEAEREAISSQADGDPQPLEAVPLETAEPSVDGRLSSLPPAADNDPSAVEATIQQDEKESE